MFFVSKKTAALFSLCGLFSVSACDSQGQQSEVDKVASNADSVEATSTAPEAPSSSSEELDLLVQQATGAQNVLKELPQEQEYSYTAQGNEPFWMFKLKDPESPHTEGVFSTPEETTSIPMLVKDLAIRPNSTQAYRYQGRGNNDFFDLTLIKEECTDSMSGAVYAETANLSVGGQVYNGCAGELLKNPEHF